MERTEAWLAVQMTGLSPAIALDLVKRLGSPEKLLEASEGDLLSAGISRKVARRMVSCEAAQAPEEVARARKAGIRVISIEDEEYPARLRTIPDPPLVLFVRGGFLPDDDTSLAVVGTRHPSPYGVRMACTISGELASMGMTIVSGLARGIDAAAHRAALDAGGRTIAVLGSGLLQIYPPEHAELADRICRQGAVVSEFLPTAPPLREHFPRRNRIISGISRGTLVVEAGARSGALITARLALEQGREVFALPGQAGSLTSSGTNRLIKDGAFLVESAADILDALNLAPRPASTVPQDGETAPTTDEEEQKVVRLLDRPKSFEELLQETHFSAAALSVCLARLELKGVVRCLPGRWYEKRA